MYRKRTLGPPMISLLLRAKNVPPHRKPTFHRSGYQGIYKVDLLRKSFLASSTTCFSAVPKDSFWTYAEGLVHKAAEFPYKSLKNKPLDTQERDYNHALSRIRVKIEHIFAKIKVFRILSHRYRNKRKRYAVKFNIIAGIVNLKNGFA